MLTLFPKWFCKIASFNDKVSFSGIYLLVKLSKNLLGRVNYVVSHDYVWLSMVSSSQHIFTNHIWTVVWDCRFYWASLNDLMYFLPKSIPSVLKMCWLVSVLGLKWCWVKRCQKHALHGHQNIFLSKWNASVRQLIDSELDQWWVPADEEWTAV